MKKKSRTKNETVQHYRFESVLPMDVAMQRLHDQMGHIHEGLFRIRRYKISSQELHDSIHFEIVTRSRPNMHKLFVTGTIREYDQNRTVLECQARPNNVKRHTVLAALPLFLSMMLVATRFDDFQLLESILLSIVGSGVLLDRALRRSAIQSWTPMTSSALKKPLGISKPWTT